MIPHTIVGAEVSIGSFLVNYLSLPGIARMPAQATAGYVSFYWGGAMIGRFLGVAVLRRFEAGHALAFCAILAVGFFNSIMSPTIFTLGLAELGPLTGNGFGLLNMAIVGGAVLPVIQGVIADRVGLHHAFVLPVICYLYIVFYALNGSKPDSVRYAT